MVGLQTGLLVDREVGNPVREWGLSNQLAEVGTQDFKMLARQAVAQSVTCPLDCACMVITRGGHVARNALDNLLTLVLRQQQRFLKCDGFGNRAHEPIMLRCTAYKLRTLGFGPIRAPFPARNAPASSAFAARTTPPRCECV